MIQGAKDEVLIEQGNITTIGGASMFIVLDGTLELTYKMLGGDPEEARPPSCVATLSLVVQGMLTRLDDMLGNRLYEQDEESLQRLIAKEEQVKD